MSVRQECQHEYRCTHPILDTSKFNQGLELPFVSRRRCLCRMLVGLLYRLFHLLLGSVCLESAFTLLNLPKKHWGDEAQPPIKAPQGSVDL